MLDKILENVGDMEGRVVHLDGLVTRLGEWGDKVTHTLVHHTLYVFRLIYRGKMQTSTR